VDQHLFEERGRPQELLVLLLRAEAHHALDASSVVPGAVEEHDLARGRQLGYVALEVPLGALAVARRWQRGDAAHARVHRLVDALDRPALACRVAALEHDHDAQPRFLDVLLELNQLELEPRELGLVRRAFDPARLVALELAASLADGLVRRRSAPRHPDVSLAVGLAFRPALGIVIGLALRFRHSFAPQTPVSDWCAWSHIEPTLPTGALPCIVARVAKRRYFREFPL